MPAAVAPGGAAPAKTSCFTFNPLFRNVPLFHEDSAAAITRAAFAADPWAYFGEESDIGVRQFGVMLAVPEAPSVRASSSSVPFSFGSASDVSLAEMRLVEPRPFQLGSAHFLITAVWQSGSTSTNLGFSQLAVRRVRNRTSLPGGRRRFGQRATCHHRSDRTKWHRVARTCIAVVSRRALSGGSARHSRGRELARFMGPTHCMCTCRQAWSRPGMSSRILLRTTAAHTRQLIFRLRHWLVSAEGQVFPPRASDPSTDPALTFRNLNRRPGAMVLTDPQRFGNDAVLVEAALLTGPSTFQTLGGIATSDQGPAVDPDLQTPDPWPAYTFAPSKNAVSGSIPEQGLLSILMRPLSGNFTPPAELVVTNRSGQSLLVYLPEVPDAPGGGVRVLVADDGSTYFAPTDATVQQSILQQRSLNGLPLARAAQGQALAIPSRWPLQQRVPVAINLCRSERASLLARGRTRNRSGTRAICSPSPGSRTGRVAAGPRAESKRISALILWRRSQTWWARGRRRARPRRLGQSRRRRAGNRRPAQPVDRRSPPVLRPRGAADRGGSLQLDGERRAGGRGRLQCRLDGSATELRTGIPVADALLGGSVTATAALREPRRAADRRTG